MHYRKFVGRCPDVGSLVGETLGGNQENSQRVFHLDEQKLRFANLFLRLLPPVELVIQLTADMMCTVRKQITNSLRFCR